MDDQIDMHHPETGGEGKATEQQFVEVWESRGWRRGTAADATEAAATDDDAGAPTEPEASPKPAPRGKRGDDTRSA